MKTERFFNTMIRQEEEKTKRLRVLKEILSNEKPELDYEKALEEGEKEIQALSKSQIIRKFLSKDDKVLYSLTKEI